MRSRPHRADPRALPLANRHYNRQNPNSPQFMPPGSCLCLLAGENPAAGALWGTLAPKKQYVQHQWAGAWTCTLFRNESAVLSSNLIRQAVAATVHRYGAAPPEGFITFVDRAQTKGKRDPGFCYLMAGWHPIGRSQKGLYAFGLGPGEMPAPMEPLPLLVPWQPSLLDLDSDPEPLLAATP